MELSFKDKVAVVTGAGSGIGCAEAIGFAKRGARVVVNDLGTSYDGKGASKGPADAVVNEIRSMGFTAVPNYDSVATEDGAESIIETAIKEFGKIDILVNNAGLVIDPPTRVYDIKTGDWELLVKTCLYGTFFCTRHASTYMKKQNYGRIVNTSSHVGYGWKGFCAYAAAKEGIVGFTRTAARDLAEFGITCNAIRPIAAWRGTKEKIPAVAVNKPEDVAALVIYLASEPADHISGRVFEVWKGHAAIFDEPPALHDRIDKDGSWTPEELAEKIPQTLTKGMSREAFPEIMHLT